MDQIHGGNLREISRRYGVPEKEILDFSANINPLGTPKTALKAMMDAMDGLVHYPEIDALTLRESLARKDRLPIDQILAGNGSTEFIYLIPRVLRPGKALVPVPSYSDYGRALALAGSHVAHFPLRKEDGFFYDTEQLIQRLRDGVDLIVLCNPNNPTGSLIPLDEIRSILSAARESSTTVVIDEAFMDFVPGMSVRFQVAEHENLLVLRSLTKFYGIPGLRAGCLYGSRSLIKRIQEKQEPWTLNRLAACAAAAALSDDAYRQKALELISAERDYLYGELGSIPGIEVFPSHANFMLLATSAPMPEADRLFEALLRSGILVRNCASFHTLGTRFLRVAGRNHDENLLLVDALRKAVRKLE